MTVTREIERIVILAVHWQTRSTDDLSPSSAAKRRPSHLTWINDILFTFGMALAARNGHSVWQPKWQAMAVVGRRAAARGPALRFATTTSCGRAMTDHYILLSKD